MTQHTSTLIPTGQPSVADMAAQTKSDRNRAVDFYRVIAMLAVAFGHWLALVAVENADGELEGGCLLYTSDAADD